MSALPALIGNNSQLQGSSLAELQRQAGTGCCEWSSCQDTAEQWVRFLLPTSYWPFLMTEHARNLRKVRLYTCQPGLAYCRGGAWNHAFFFKHLAPAGTEQAKYDTAASDKLQGAINNGFGDFDSFKAQLTTAASSVFGSGWA